MPPREVMIKAIEEYCRAETEKDKTAWATLFADDVRHEDPVGAPVNIGREKVLAFWDSFQSYDIELWLAGPIIICGNEAIAPMKARLGPREDRKETGPIYDHITFDKAGKIVSLRAFYEPF